MIHHHVTISFGENENYEIELHESHLADFPATDAQLWLSNEFAAAGCEPSDPVGKILLVDKILQLAETRPREDFSQPSAWVRDYARAALAALGRNYLRIDLAQRNLGY